MDTASDDLVGWGAAHDLTEKTIQVLRQEEFTSLRLLANLTPDDIKETFQIPKLLSLAQCVALRNAVAELAGRGIEAQHESPAFSSRPVTGPAQSTRNIADNGVADYVEDQPAGGATHSRCTSSAPHHTGTVSQARTERRRQEPEEELRFLLLGKTGSGKSTTGNTILGEDRFPTELAFGSVTAECQLERVTRNGITIEIMDSPGLFDTERSHEDISADIVKAVACMYPGPHAILYVIRFGRYTDEEFQVYQRLKALFDDVLSQFMIVLFTGGDLLEGKGRSIGEVLQSAPNELKQVLNECNNRHVVFNNLAENKQPQVEILFGQVRQLIAQNGGRFYICPKYTEVGEGLQAEVARRLAEVDRRKAENSTYVQNLRRQAQSAEEAVQEERARYEAREREREELMQREQHKARQQMEELMQELSRQQADSSKQHEEQQRLRQQLQMQLEEQKRAVEEEREAERRRLVERERELAELRNKEEEFQWNTSESQELEWREVLRETKDRVARGLEDGFVRACAKAVGKIVQKVKSFFNPRKH